MEKAKEKAVLAAYCLWPAKVTAAIQIVCVQQQNCSFPKDFENRRDFEKMRITSTILTLLAVGMGRKQGVWALINGGYDCEDARNTLQKWLCSVPTRRFRGARSHR